MQEVAHKAENYKITIYQEMLKEHIPTCLFRQQHLHYHDDHRVFHICSHQIFGDHHKKKSQTKKQTSRRKGELEEIIFNISISKQFINIL